MRRGGESHCDCAKTRGFAKCRKLDGGASRPVQSQRSERVWQYVVSDGNSKPERTDIDVGRVAERSVRFGVTFLILLHVVIGHNFVCILLYVTVSIHAIPTGNCRKCSHATSE